VITTLMQFIEDSWIFDEYRKAFRHYTPPIYAQETMLDSITDKEAWAKTCHEWAMNDYKPSSVGKMIDYYNKVKVTLSRVTVGGHSACPYCGQVGCLGGMNKEYCHG